MKTWTCALLLALGALLCGASVAEEHTLVRSFEGIESVDLDLRSSDAEITRSSSSKVSVTVRWTFDDDFFHPELEQRGSRLRLKERFDREWHVRGSATWFIALPDNVEIHAELGSGDLSVAGLSTRLDASLGSGDIDLTDIEGNVKVGEGSGDAELRNVTGEIRVSQGSGDLRVVRLKGALRGTTGSGDAEVADAHGELEVSSGSGDVELADADGSFQVRVGSGSIKGRNVSVQAESTFRTGSGDVGFRDTRIDAAAQFTSGSGDTEVALTASPAADVSLKSGSGDAILAYGGNPIAGQFTMQADKRRGRIEAPFRFDREYEVGSDRYPAMVKEATIGDQGPSITIVSGSGTAAIRK